MERLADGTLRFRRPDGRLLPDVAPPPVITDDPIPRLRALNEAAGLRLDGRTLCPAAGWQRFDVAYAIDVLHPLALSTAPERR